MKTLEEYNKSVKSEMFTAGVLCDECSEEMEYVTAPNANSDSEGDRGWLRMALMTNPTTIAPDYNSISFFWHILVSVKCPNCKACGEKYV